MPPEDSGDAPRRPKRKAKPGAKAVAKRKAAAKRKTSAKRKAKPAKPKATPRSDETQEYSLGDDFLEGAGLEGAGDETQVRKKPPEQTQDKRFA